MSYHHHRPKGFLPPSVTTGSEEQGYVENVFRGVGARLWRIVCPKGGHGTPGVSDDLFFFPGPRILLAWDAKTGDERYKPNDARRLSVEQREFGALMSGQYRTTFGFGDRVGALAWVRANLGAEARARLDE